MKGTTAYILSKTEIAMATLGVASITTSGNTITIKYNAGNTATLTVNPPKGDKGTSITKVEIDINNHLICTFDDNTTTDAGELPSGGSGTTDYADLTNKPSINGVELSGNKTLTDLGITNYDDTQVKTDISDLDTNKQDKTDNTLDTTNKTVVGAINEINDNLLDNVTFSADYKNIIINRKSGLNPYTIPISSIIHNAKITELNDVDSTNIGDGKTLVYDDTTKKHKYVDSTGTDELVKMDSTTNAKYLGELIDKSTIVNENGVLKAKKLDGQQVTITEINYLKGLTMNVMDLVNTFANGGVKIINTPVSTYADLLAYDKTGLIDGISYLVYVLADETHDNAKTTYLIDKTSSTPTYFGFAGEHRDFTTNPIDLANEVTGKLGTTNIDIDALWSLLTINDTYKTLTTKDEVFGTHGAKALYDELVTSIGKKANATDLTTHTSDTNIHVTTSDKTKWNKVDNKVDKTDLTSHTSNKDIHITSSERTKWNKVDNKVDKTNIIDNLTSTNTDKPLSANQGKVLKGEVDKKANDNEVIKKTAITTTINSASTASQVPSAKTYYNDVIKNNNMKSYYVYGVSSLGLTAPVTFKDVWDKIDYNTYFVIDTDSSQITDLPHLVSPSGTVTNTYGLLTICKFKERTRIEYKRAHTSGTTDGAIWFGDIVGGNCSNLSWYRASVYKHHDDTSMNEGSINTIEFTSTTNYKHSSAMSLKYIIIKGICYVSGGINCISPSSTRLQIATLPKPITGYQYYKTINIADDMKDLTNETNTILILLDPNGWLGLSQGVAGKEYRVTFSYPVASS